jgi:hypothetical protein
MDDELEQLIAEAVLLEKNVARLYTLFKEAFPEDADFWDRLADEEKNHAALIRTVKDFFLTMGLVPSGLFTAPREELKRSNAKIGALIERYRSTPPLRREAFLAAVDIEETAGEIHYQKYMNGESIARIDDIFKELNEADKDHAARIRAYMEEHRLGS